jgi:hypothetical protein
VLGLALVRAVTADAQLNAARQQAHESPPGHNRLPEPGPLMDQEPGEQTAPETLATGRTELNL